MTCITTDLASDAAFILQVFKRIIHIIIFLFLFFFEFQHLIRTHFLVQLKFEFSIIGVTWRFERLICSVGPKFRTLVNGR